MFIKVVGATEIKSAAIFTVDLVGGLMEYLSAERQFFRDFALK